MKVKLCKRIGFVLAFSLTTLSQIGIEATFRPATADALFCYMQTQSGRMVDLTSLCGAGEARVQPTSSTDRQRQASSMPFAPSGSVASSSNSAGGGGSIAGSSDSARSGSDDPSSNIEWGSIDWGGVDANGIHPGHINSGRIRSSNIGGSGGSGNCATANDRAADGSRCGGRAADQR